MKLSIICSLLLMLLQFSFAQQQKREDDVFFKKYLVRSMDLRDKGNEEIFGSDRYIVQALLNAYCSGNIKGYKNEKLNESLSYNDFDNRLNLFQEVATAESAWTGLPLIEIGENLIFNKHTSDFYFSMQTLTLYIPAEMSHRGLQEPLISFAYQDCSRIFKSDPEAISVNPLKNGRNINYADLFLLRCFNSSIVKIGNSRDLYFDQAHADKLSAFLAAKDGEHQLTEYLYKLYHPE